MKTFVAFLAVASVAAPLAQSQVFRPETVNGAVLGGIAGAVIGNNSGDLRHNAWRGAAIGSVAGAVIGSAFGEAREDASGRVPQPYRARVWGGYDRHVGPSWHYGHYDRVGYGHWNHHHRHGYYTGIRFGAPVYYSSGWAPSYGYGYGYYRAGRGYAANGTLLGGIAGAIIGHNSGDLRHSAWRGAALGAGAGWLIGAIADERARERDAQVVERPDVYAPEDSAPPARTTAGAPQNVTIINNYYGSTNPAPMAAANGLFGR